MPFRDAILRGVRLFLLAFAAILVAILAVKTFRAPADEPAQAVQGAPAVPEAQPAPDPAPVSEAAATDAQPDVHPLVVPPPPPVGGPAPIARIPHKVVRARTVEAPPVTVVRAKHAAAPTSREFKATEVGALPAAPVEEPSETIPAPATNGVGYKSLIEANDSRPPVVEPAAIPSGVDSGTAHPKGNRFVRALGKIFHPTGKKETTPQALQPNQQPD